MPSVVLVHTPNLQDPADFLEIAARIRALDSRIKVYVANNTERNEDINQQILSDPTLVFSPVKLEDFAPARGIVYEGGSVDKIVQYRMLLGLGIATPRTALLSPGAIYAPEEWGEEIVLKPLSPKYQSNGQRIFRMETRRLNYDLNVTRMFDRYHVDGGTLVQQFIDTGPHLEYHRVLTLFGQPLYAMTTRLKHALAEKVFAYPTGTAPVATQSFSPKDKVAVMIEDPRYLDLASSAYPAFPRRALQAIDILRCDKTDELYVLEMNLGGNTWHFSSGMIGAINASSRREEFRRKKIDQFGAFEIAAKLLASRALAEGV